MSAIFRRNQPQDQIVPLDGAFVKALEKKGILLEFNGGAKTHLVSRAFFENLPPGNYYIVQLTSPRLAEKVDEDQYKVFHRKSTLRGEEQRIVMIAAQWAKNVARIYNPRVANKPWLNPDGFCQIYTYSEDSAFEPHHPQWHLDSLNMARKALGQPLLHEMLPNPAAMAAPVRHRNQDVAAAPVIRKKMQAGRALERPVGPLPLAANGGKIATLTPAFVEQLAERGVYLGFNLNTQNSEMSYAFFEALPPGNYYLIATNSPRLGEKVDEDQYRAFSQESALREEKRVILISVHWARHVDKILNPKSLSKPWFSPDGYCQIYSYDQILKFVPDHHRRQLESLELIHRALPHAEQAMVQDEDAQDGGAVRPVPKSKVYSKPTPAGVRRPREPLVLPQEEEGEESGSAGEGPFAFKPRSSVSKPIPAALRRTRALGNLPSPNEDSTRPAALTTSASARRQLVVSSDDSDYDADDLLARARDFRAGRSNAERKEGD